MPRNILYTALTFAVLGTLALGFAGRLTLAVGWWIGIWAALLNYSWLLSRVRTNMVRDRRKLTGTFFIRYLALALIFFLALRLGRAQLGSCMVGFGSFYIVLSIDYLIRVRNRK